MICVSALVVLSILGIFSATHRQLAKEALDCVLRRVTLQPCDTGFDTKIRAKVLGNLISWSPPLAKFVRKYFEVLAWAFMLLFVVSVVFTVRGLANFYLYGSCNGLNASGFCVFDPAGENNQTSLSSEAECRVTPPSEDDLTLEGVDLSLFPTKPLEGGKKFLFIGCYNCDYTRKAYPMIQKLMEEEPMNYTFAHFPTKEETEYLSAYGTCIYDQNPEAFWKWNDALFNTNKELVADRSYVHGLLLELGVDGTQVETCVEAEETKEEVEAQMRQLHKIGVYGTPTIFIEERPLVGPKPFRVYKRILNGGPFSLF